MNVAVQPLQVVAGEYLPSSRSAPDPNAGGGITLPSTGAVLQRVTIVTFRLDDTVVLGRADYSPPAIAASGTYENLSANAQFARRRAQRRRHLSAKRSHFHSASVSGTVCEVAARQRRARLIQGWRDRRLRLITDFYTPPAGLAPVSINVRRESAAFDRAPQRCAPILEMTVLALAILRVATLQRQPRDFRYQEALSGA